MILKLQERFDPEFWVFDNDGTLYENPEDLEREFSQLAMKLISELFDIPNEKAKEKLRELFEKHNTKYTLIALSKEGFDEEMVIQKTYLSINLKDAGLKHNEGLRGKLKSLKGKRYVLTNNPSAFAEMILRVLGIDDLFESIVGLQEMNYIQKPDVNAFRALGIEEEKYKKTVFLDDEWANLQAAKELGFITAHVAKGGEL